MLAAVTWFICIARACPTDCHGAMRPRKVSKNIEFNFCVVGFQITCLWPPASTIIIITQSADTTKTVQLHPPHQQAGWVACQAADIATHAAAGSAGTALTWCEHAPHESKHKGCFVLFPDGVYCQLISDASFYSWNSIIFKFHRNLHLTSVEGCPLRWQ